MPWVYLIIAGVLEIGWAIGLKMSEGWTKPVASVLTAVGLVGSIYFLNIAVKDLPIGTAYAVWTGIGTIGAAILGIVLFDEPRTVGRLICIGMIVAGILGLKIIALK